MKYIQKFTLKQYRVLADMTQEQLAAMKDVITELLQRLLADQEGSEICIRRVQDL